MELVGNLIGTFRNNFRHSTWDAQFVLYDKLSKSHLGTMYCGIFWPGMIVYLAHPLQCINLLSSKISLSQEKKCLVLKLKVGHIQVYCKSLGK